MMKHQDFGAECNDQSSKAKSDLSICAIPIIHEI